MKKIFFLIIFIILLLISSLVVIMVMSKNKEQEPQNIDISYCRYSNSGDSLGGHYSILYHKETNKIVITEQETHNSVEEITEYPANEECISKLEDILRSGLHTNIVMFML